MSDRQPDKLSLKMPGMVIRKALLTSEASQESLVKIEQLHLGQALPLLIQPAVDGIDLAAWATNNRQLIDKYLLKHGGILFRNFSLRSAEDFEQCITGASGEPLEYHERSSPRSQISGNIYTSTDHPADQSIFLHNESSYQQNWPLRIFFFCKLPALQGGETPIADARKIYKRIDPAIRDRFRQKQVMYIRNLGDGFGLSWQTVFQTTDKQAVEQYCQKSGIQCEWKSDDRLRTRYVRPAIVSHPYTREMLWFNHATFFHITTLEPTIRDALLAEFQEEDLPNNTYYGDGTPIENAVLDELRQAYIQETVAFPWQKGDFLMLDNMLTSHGRTPFVGPRQVLTGMSRLIHRAELPDETN
ncbi:MAG TPA: TauD/TfdA family dioxygenase [Ktedonobacteraceae bacterium]|jgi:alpha-ketoglutarate-dependent taurine dioxygenase|nr:TauD/TfdA family dioxygenase [Ktedonobacteraceae bacterium]